MSKKTVLVDFDGGTYFFAGKEPRDFIPLLEKQKYIALPSGSVIATSSVKGVYTYEDYQNLHETADRSKRHEWLAVDGYWHAADGAMLEKAQTKRLINQTIQHVPETNKNTLSSGAARIGQGATGVQVD